MTNPVLKTKRRIVLATDYNDLDNFISQVYGRDFESIADQEWSNYEDHEINVEPEPLDAYDEKKLKDFLAGEWPSGMLHILLTDMANRKLIEPGNYLISVFW